MNQNPLEGSLLKGMLLFAFPIAISALMTMLFSCVDAMIVGRFGHENALAAIGVSSSIINMLVGGVTALASGVTVTAGKYYGQANKEKIKELLQSIPLTSFFLGFILSVCAIVLSEPIMRFLNCPDQIQPNALDYFRIYFMGVPFTVLSAFLSAIIQAKGNSFPPFLFQSIAAVSNIILDLFFVIVLNLNVVGVAAATVLSQVLLAFLLLIYLAKQTDELKFNPKGMTFFTNLRDCFTVGIPSSLEGVVLNLSGVIIASTINRFDANVIAGNSVATTVEGIMVVTFTGFAGASTVFVAQNYGSGNMERVSQSVKITIATVFFSAEIVGILLYILSPKLLLLFTTDFDILQNAHLRMKYMCLFFGFCGVMNVISHCTLGLGDAKTPLIISILCSVAFRLTWIYTYAAWKGTIDAIYISYPICWMLSCLLNLIAFIRLFSKRIHQRNRECA